jgi:streptogramin lyase
LALDDQGNLVLHAGDGDVVEQAPVLYQQLGGVRQAVAGHYRLEENGQVTFTVGAYDPSQPLIIDPVLSYSTYLGGSTEDRGESIAVDGAGNVYVTGFTFSTNFPTVNPVQAANWGHEDVFVSKLNAAGTALVYSTYLGGSGSDLSSGIVVNSQGDAIFTGSTTSANFPTVNAVQSSIGGSGFDAFVAELNPAGSGLVFSTYLGGNGTDIGAGVALDPAGNIYLTGQTSSTNFPTANPLQVTNHGGTHFGYDAYVTKLNSTGTAMVYSTYLGGSGDDEATGIGVDSAGNAYVNVATNSSDMPTVNPIQASYGGGSTSGGDAYVAKINAAGSALVYATYLGGNGDDIGNGIAVDGAGEAVVTGYTTSSNFPTANALQPAFGGGYSDAFVTKLNATGTALIYSTYFGGSGQDNARGIALDSSGNAYVTGITSSSNLPTVNPVQPTPGGLADAFVTELNAGGSALIYSTYLGGSGDDVGEAIAVDGSGSAYITGETGSTDFPTVGPLQGTNAGGLYDAFIAKIGAPAPSAVLLGVCAPATVTAGSTFTVTVTALDASNNPAAGYTGTVHFTSSDKAAVLPPDYTFTAADNGKHTFSVTLKGGGSRTITVTDTVKSTVTGKAVASAEFATPTTASNPEGISAGPDGNVWFAETGSNKIGRMSPTGGITEFTIPTANSQPVGIVNGPDNKLWFTESNTNQIGRVTRTGGFTEFTVPTPNSKPWGITAGPDGNLWFTETGANKIGRITRTGTVTEFALAAGSEPEGIAPGSDGNLWFTETGADKIGKITPTGAVTEYALLAGSAPEGITAGPDKNLWFADTGVNRIGQITTAGLVTVFNLPTAGSRPAAFGKGPDSNLWFTESSGNRLGQITPGGAITEFPIVTANSQPLGITAAPDGSLWYSASAAGRIGRLSPAIIVNPAAASVFKVSGFPSTCKAGTAYTFIVTALDAYGNGATGYRGTVQFTSSDSQALLPVAYTFKASDKGKHTFTATLKTVGTQSISATDMVDTSLTGLESGIDVVP